MKYTNFFERNSTNKRMVIEVALENYDDYYRAWDNASYRKRDIDPDLFAFICECSDMIPLKEKLEIRFTLGDQQRDETYEQQIITSYQNYTNAEHYIQKEKVRSKKISVSKDVIIGVILLWASFFFGKMLNAENLLIEILLEGFLIGGWVFLWEALYISSFSLRDEATKSRKLNRLTRAILQFSYAS